jgi:ribosomal protein S18 acetylase RimI-like enzyme
MRMHFKRFVLQRFASVRRPLPPVTKRSDTPIAAGKRLVAKPDRCVLGAWIESDLVGMVGLWREQARKLSHKAFIWGMYVAPAARRRGMGGRLLAQALARAASMPGVRQINLGVNAANAEAVALYEAAGFISFGVERGFMLLNGQLHDEIHMVRTVETAATK